MDFAPFSGSKTIEIELQEFCGVNGQGALAAGAYIVLTSKVFYYHYLELQKIWVNITVGNPTYLTLRDSNLTTIAYLDCIGPGMFFWDFVESPIATQPGTQLRLYSDVNPITLQASTVAFSVKDETQ